MKSANTGSNLSQLIDPDICVNVCGGECCKTFTMSFSKNSDAVKYGEVHRYALLDTGKIWVEDKGDSFVVHFDFPCSKFENGMCSIYDDASRPKLCRLYPFKEDTHCPFKK